MGAGGGMPALLGFYGPGNNFIIYYILFWLYTNRGNPLVLPFSPYIVLLLVLRIGGFRHFCPAFPYIFASSSTEVRGIPSFLVLFSCIFCLFKLRGAGNPAISCPIFPYILLL